MPMSRLNPYSEQLAIATTPSNCSHAAVLKKIAFGQVWKVWQVSFLQRIEVQDG